MLEQIPVTEPERQYYFIEKAKELVKEREETLGRPLSYAVVTFGCQMNARDSEKLRGILKAVGYQEAPEEQADFVIYNTCTVRENANSRLYGRLGQQKPRKKKNKEMMIALCGCMMQEPQVVEKLKKSYSFVDIIFGTHNIYKFAELLATRLQSGRMVIDIWKDTDKIVEDLPNQRKYPFKSGINIMFGCNNFCSYCIVPYVRGRERSRKPDAIIKEIRRMAEDGVSEIMLLGQNVNSYGKTLDEPITFARLLEKVEEVEGIHRIRFMTSHPKDLSDELIQVMAKSKKICRHLHLPVQSGSTRILRKMNRRYTKEQYLDLAERIKKAVPGISLSTDIIVGFPGEKEQDFEESAGLVEECLFCKTHIFKYSKRPMTKAASMKDHVAPQVKNRRSEMLHDVGRLSAKKFFDMNKATVHDVILEEKSEDGSMALGYTENYIRVYIPLDHKETKLPEGIVKVRLKDIFADGMTGELVKQDI